MALAGAVEVAGIKGTVLLAGGTDGTDGPTDAAGAVATWRTIECAVPAHAAHVGTRATKELSDASGVRLARAFLANNDAYTYFDRAGRGLLKTGPTGTNVMDVTLALVDSVEEAS